MVFEIHGTRVNLPKLLYQMYKTEEEDPVFIESGQRFCSEYI